MTWVCRGSLKGLDFQPIFGSASEQMCSPTPGMAGSGTWLHLGFGGEGWGVVVPDEGLG